MESKNQKCLRAGVLTTHERKGAFVERLSDVLIHERLRFSHNFIVKNPLLSTSQSESIAEFKRELINQMFNFKKIFILPLAVSSDARVAFTGKYDAETNKLSKRYQDDIVMALMMNIFYEFQITQGNIKVSPINAWNVTER